MIDWNTDVEAAKSAGWVLVCVDDEKRWVGLSCWLEDQQRWNMIGTNEKPYAWSEVNHPLSDTPFVKPMGLTTVPPPMIPKIPVAVVKPTPTVTLPPGLG